MRDWQKVERVAHLMADAAGRSIIPLFRTAVAVENKAKSGFDPVTVADRAAEKAIRDVIEEHFPDDGILGEEYGERKGSSGYTWILDPIDGTRAFITGIPLWGTLIALHNGEYTQFGMMDQPFLRERYTANETLAQLTSGDAEPVTLRTRQCDSIENAVLMCTSPDIFTPDELSCFERVVSHTSMLRFGGDCYAYCMLASGHIDLVIEAGLAAYDIQALIPIVQSAGGIVTDWSGKPITSGGAVVAAGDPGVHAQALALLNQQE